MVAAIDSGLDFFRQVLALRSYRQQVLSADIANASTPGFKATDLDFKAAMQAAAASDGGSPIARSSPSLLRVDDARQLGASAPVGASVRPADFVKYQTDSEVTLDGNSVDLDHEKVAAAENAVQYEAAATFTAQTVRMLTVAINGAGAQSGSGS
jgi:flagellar basal-body rod protein FlgB